MKGGQITSFMLTIISVFVLVSGSGNSQKWLPQDFTLTDTDGNTFTLSDHRGKVVLIDFFATSCPPCWMLHEEFKSLREDFGEEELVIISISLGTDTNAVLREYKSMTGANWTFARDTEDLAISYTVSHLPTIVVIDTNGYIHTVFDDFVDSTELASDTQDARTGYEPPQANWALLLGVLVVLAVVVTVIYLVFMKGERGS